VVTQSPTVTAAVPPEKSDKEESSRGRTQEQRQQEQETNRSNRSDVATEGNVVDVERTPTGLTITIGTVDGLVTVHLVCTDTCPSVLPGHYVQVEGTKVHEQLYDAESVTVAD
jgi:hypothetical protein